ncbi:MAG: serine hydrolase, partial [Bacteroidota bacterium]
KSASASTFGHTGFTGTAVWADPEHDLIFILLTNRVHPNKYNRKLQRYDIRAQMHQAVYDALGTAKVDVK